MISDQNEVITMSLTDEEIKALQDDNATLKQSNESMQTKMDELLGETKNAKKAAKEAAEQARVAAEEKAAKDGDYEQLFKSSEEKTTKLQDELAGLKNGISTEKVKNQAKSIANQLAEGTNVDLLSTFIAPRLKFIDGEVKVLDSKGQLTVSSVDDLVKEFQSNDVYKSLLKGNQSSGGGAPGGKSGGATDKVLTRADFEGLNPIKKMEFTKSGGKIID